MARHRTTLAKLALFLLSAGFLASAHADTLDMRSTAPAADDGRPTRGMTQINVEARYGAPVSKKAPVGDPPISRWEYQNMVVYFEYDRVIHAVMKR